MIKATIIASVILLTSLPVRNPDESHPVIPPVKAETARSITPLTANTVLAGIFHLVRQAVPERGLSAVISLRPRIVTQHLAGSVPSVREISTPLFALHTRAFDSTAGVARVSKSTHRKFLPGQNSMISRVRFLYNPLRLLWYTTDTGLAYALISSISSLSFIKEKRNLSFSFIKECR